MTVASLRNPCLAIRPMLSFDYFLLWCNSTANVKCFNLLICNLFCLIMPWIIKVQLHIGCLVEFSKGLKCKTRNVWCFIMGYVWFGERKCCSLMFKPSQRTCADLWYHVSLSASGAFLDSMQSGLSLQLSEAETMTRTGILQVSTSTKSTVRSWQSPGVTTEICAC